MCNVWISQSLIYFLFMSCSSHVHSNIFAEWWSVVLHEKHKQDKRQEKKKHQLEKHFILHHFALNWMQLLWFCFFRVSSSILSFYYRILPASAHRVHPFTSTSHSTVICSPIYLSISTYNFPQFHPIQTFQPFSLFLEVTNSLSFNSDASNSILICQWNAFVCFCVECW